jgi:hypothetical protein
MANIPVDHGRESASRLPSVSVPQADNPRILILAWRLLADGDPCDADTLGVHPRQVAYYRSALRILGLPRTGGPNPPDSDEPDLEVVTSLRYCFESSPCGRAWLEWAGADSLTDIDPGGAYEFLKERSELTGATLERRSLSLRRWHAWMTNPDPAAIAESQVVQVPDAADVADDNAPAHQGNYKPKRRSTNVPWLHWTYNDWNDRLVEHYFEIADDSAHSPVLTRIPATPEDLAELVGASADDSAMVTDVFVKCLVKELAPGTSFCGFCFDYGTWSPQSPDPPHFFAMLWFTCLVAYGYPNSEGSFAERFHGLLSKTDNFRHRNGGSLPDLWHDLASWSRRRRDAGDAIRELEVPPPGHRKVIGYSYYLAFPNRADRTALAKLLWEAGLVGFEPPVQPVLSALLRARNLRVFSTEFCEDLKDFGDRYATGDDPRDSAFWRAIRQEALTPSTDPSSPSGERAPRSWLLFMEDEQGLRPLIGCNSDSALPQGFEVHRFEDPNKWNAYVTGAEGDLDAAWEEAFSFGRLLPIGARKLIAQGLLVLRETRSAEYEVVHGSDLHGCQRALVRSPLLSAFLNAFGGRISQPSIVDGWHEVEACQLRQVDDLPAGLDGVTQLLRTMNPPTLALVGGIRTDGAYLFNSKCFPKIRAPGVQSVVVKTNYGTRPCKPNTQSPGDWELPYDVEFTEELVLEASWSFQVGGRTVVRASQSEIRFTPHSFNDQFKDKPKGHYFMESCPDPEADVVHYAESPLGITAANPTQSADLLEFDVTARFLGPGLGEMSLERQEGFDWLVIGKKKSPDLLVFVGDVTRPVMPAQRRSESKGDRRHWKQALDAKRAAIRSADGAYLPLDAAPDEVKVALAAFKRHKVETVELLPATGLETQIELELPRATPTPSTSEATDVLAALASRRKGLTYSEVREVFSAILGRDSPIEVQQILRGWTEAGLVDVLRSAQVSRFVIVPRRPRLVMVRRGLNIEATVIGLITSVRRRQIEAALSDNRSVTGQPLLPANIWQPSTFRIQGNFESLEQLRVRSGLGSSEWLEWPDGRTPDCLDIAMARTRLNNSPPPVSFRFDAGWDWARTSFFRGHRDSGAVRLERRVHRDSSTIYVILRDDSPLLWTYSRSWALLEGYAARGTPAFRVERRILTTTGTAPVHLPLPVGRLCVLIGEGLPGPTLEGTAIRYSYPFGPRLFKLVERVVPPVWLDTSSSYQSNRSTHAGPHR